MSNNDNKPNITPEGINSLSDEEAITEIDIGSFLNNKESDAVLYDGFHEDIRKTEQSLEDEIQSLMDSIMSSGGETIVPKSIEDIIQPVKNEQAPLGEVWMNPEEYIDIPDLPKVKPNETELNPTPKSDIEKNDLFDMINTLKADTDSETGYDDLLADIQQNQNLDSVDIDTHVNSIASDFRPAEKLPDPPAPVKPKAEANEIDINSEDFDSQLAILLGDASPEKEEKAEVPVKKPVPAAPVAQGVQITESVAPVKKEPFKVTIDEDSFAQPVAYDVPKQNQPPVFDILPGNGQRTVGNIPTEIIEDDGKISRREKKEAKRDSQIAQGKNPNVAEAIRKTILAISILVIIASSGVLINTYIIEPYKFKKNQSEIADIIVQPANPNEQVDSSDTANSKYPEGMLTKYRKLFDINEDVAGWISIPGLEINLPLAKSKDNDYYLHRNIYGKRTNYGVPFFDYRIEDLKNLPRNTVIYGHNMHYDDLIFGMLENYREIDGFKQAPAIECNTIYADYTWLVYAVFITNSKESQDNGYVLTYNFLDISEMKFEEYIKEIDKRKFYTTGVDIQPTDKILTISTCCYDFDDARLVVVARLKRDGESSSVDVSKAVKTDNPKYPQAWYTANKKTNLYVGDTKWYPNS